MAEKAYYKDLKTGTLFIAQAGTQSEEQNMFFKTRHGAQRFRFVDWKDNYPRFAADKRYPEDFGFSPDEVVWIL